MLRYVSELKTNISTNNFLNWNFVKYDLKTYFPTLYKKLQKEDKETNDFKKIENILLSTNSIIKEKNKIYVELEKKYNISYEHKNIAYNFLNEKEKTYNNCLLQLLEKFNVHGGLLKELCNINSISSPFCMISW